MFYTEGILVSVFSPLMMAGSTVCTPGYNPLNFFAWLDLFRPSWYAAPTTIQRSILGRAPLHSDIVAHSRLRVIRCSSAPADSELISQIENLFRAPMLDSYGMTETSSTIAGEPLARGKRKPGSVGIAVGCEVAAVDEQNVFLPVSEIGEIIVRGPSVIHAYEGEGRTNQRSFLNGWLRTGDLGKIDRDGYLFLTGRIKELINRGGEKISPVEIDEAFNAHPAVAEAMAFALPDKSLGEEIAVAVVLRDGRVPSRQF
jgi:acyl-CoA synthetase (AMP-forming)/AMP-acid ligase II